MKGFLLLGVLFERVLFVYGGFFCVCGSDVLFFLNFLSA